MVVETSVIVAATVTIIIAIIGYLYRRQVEQLDKKIDSFAVRLDRVEDMIKEHESRIAVNAERDKSDYRLIQTELSRLRHDIDKEIKNLNILNETKLKSIEVTLDRILNKLGE